MSKSVHVLRIKIFSVRKIDTNIKRAKKNSVIFNVKLNIKRIFKK
jgi:hypothetical protein